MDEFDLDSGGASAPPDKLAALHASLEEAIALEEAVEQLEDDLKAAKKSLHTLRSSRIPDMMDELRMDDLTFMGWKVKIADFVSGSLPKDDEKRKKAIEWLENNDGASLVKTQIGLSFGRSQHNEALAIADELRQKGQDPVVESGVHAQTLQAFARERIKNGEAIDIDALGLYVGKVAKLKRTTA